MQEARDTAQQRGLAGAIGPQQLQRLPTRDSVKLQPSQQMPLAAPQMQVV